MRLGLGLALGLGGKSSAVAPGVRTATLSVTLGQVILASTSALAITGALSAGIGSVGLAAAATKVAVPITVYLTSGSTWTVPADYVALISAEAIGPGGNGVNGVVNALAGAGGGGGEYRKIIDATNLVANDIVDVRIGTGGSGDSTYLEDNTGAKILEAMAGANGSSATGGAGGSGGIGGADNANGGAGGAGQALTTARGGGGGGGAGGPLGAGGNGAGSSSSGGGGGGGNGGGSAGSAGTASAGNGGNNNAGSGGGVAPGGAGSNGGGGAGNVSGTVAGAGGAGVDLDATHGGGGGGGGGPGASSGSRAGGAGGNYGAGGGGGGSGGSSQGNGGAGAPGLIKIVYSVEPLPPFELMIAGEPETGAVEGVAYSWTPEVSGGTEPYAFSNIGTALPAGWSLNTGSGELACADPDPAQQPTNVIIQVASDDGQTDALAAFSVHIFGAEGTTVATDEEMVEALAAYASTGGDIIIAKSNSLSESLTLTQVPSAPIRFLGEDESDWSPFPHAVTFSAGSGPFTFQWLDIETDDGKGTYQSVFIGPNTGYTNDFVMRHCRLHGPEYDPNGTYGSGSGYPTIKRGFQGRFDGFVVEDCEWSAFQTCMKPLQFRGVISLCRNKGRLIHEDFIEGGLDPANCPSVKANFNFSTQYTGRAAEGPHCDQIHFWLTSPGPVNLEIIGNIYVKGDARGSAHSIYTEGMGSDFGATVICDNICITDIDDDFAPGMGEHSPGLLNRFWLLRWNPSTSTGQGDANIYTTLGQLPAAVADCYVEGYAVRNGTQFINVESSALFSAASKDAYQTANFEGPFTGSWPTTMAAAEAIAKPKAGGRFAAFRDACDYAGYTQLMPPRTYIPVEHQRNQTIDGTYTTAWMPFVGGDPAGRVISDVLSGTTYRLADDASGTGATSYTSSGTTTTKGYIQLAVELSSDGHTAVEWGLTVDGYEYSRYATTSPTTAWPAADNQGSGVVRMANAENIANRRRFLGFIEFQFNGVPVNNNGITSGSDWYATQSAQKYQGGFRSSGSVGVTTPVLPDAKRHRMFWTADFTKNTAAEVWSWWMDEDLMQYLAATIHTGASLVFNPASDLANMGLGAVNPSFPSDITYWACLVDWGDGSLVLPDLSDINVRNLFNRDDLGSDGSAVLGHAAKGYWYGDPGASDGSTPNTWNATAGLVNRGSVATMNLVKSGGTFA